MIRPTPREAAEAMVELIDVPDKLPASIFVGTAAQKLRVGGCDIVTLKSESAGKASRLLRRVLQNIFEEHERELAELQREIVELRQRNLATDEHR